MMDYVVLPTSGEYDFICEELIARWPKLKDESIGGSSDEAYVSQDKKSYIIVQVIKTTFTKGNN